MVAGLREHHRVVEDLAPVDRVFPACHGIASV